MATSSDGHCDADERTLLDAACMGDQQAFGALLEGYSPELEEFCGLMLGHPRRARAARREVVLTAWRERDQACPSAPVRMWLYRIAVRVCSEALERL